MSKKYTGPAVGTRRRTVFDALLKAENDQLPIGALRRIYISSASRGNTNTMDLYRFLNKVALKRILRNGKNDEAHWMLKPEFWYLHSASKVPPESLPFWPTPCKCTKYLLASVWRGVIDNDLDVHTRINCGVNANEK
jgi:hypothetical protein